jgi:hypothetical protein
VAEESDEEGYQTYHGRQVHYPYANISYIGLRNSVADPDPHVFGPPGSGSISAEAWIRIRVLLSSSKNSKKNLDSYCFVTSFLLFFFEKLCKCTFKK